MQQKLGKPLPTSTRRLSCESLLALPQRAALLCP